MSSASSAAATAAQCLAPEPKDIGEAAIGVCVAVLSMLLFTLGAMLQKKSHAENSAAPPEKRAVEFWGFVISWRWMLGLLLMSVLPIPLQSIAANFASSRLLAQFGGLALLLTLALAPFILGETAHHEDKGAVMLMVAGVTALNSFSPPKTTSLSMTELFQTWQEASFIISEAVTLVFLVGALVGMFKPDRSQWALRYRPAVCGCVAGVLNAQFMLLAQGLNSIMNSSIAAHPFDQGAETYAFIVAALVLFIAQLSSLNFGLVQFDAVLFMPLFFATRIVCIALVGGLGLHKQYVCYSFLAWSVVAVGLSATIGAMVLLVRVRRCDAYPDADVDGGDGETRTAADADVGSGAGTDWTSESAPLVGRGSKGARVTLGVGGENGDAAAAPSSVAAATMSAGTFAGATPAAGTAAAPGANNSASSESAEMHGLATDDAQDRSGYPRSMSGGIPRGNSLYDNPLFDPSASNRRASGGVTSSASQPQSDAGEDGSSSQSPDRSNENDDIMLA